ncbi:restriction endonuclease subunit S [Vibrio fluvialis]|uniref:restriction endonuclease subunit S n=1 Tax=Vibrio fluvialis TaxID=676 RepID=UPI000CEB7456|nr:restriction endonuclease subunit S [Vibrio fluvialis]AVH31082.1 restriction endonuclease subunit S [Vibrio fluvialis]
MEWPIKKLSDICENLDSKRVPITKKDRIEGPYPYYGASGVVDSVSDYLFNEDLLLVSEDGANLLARTYPIAFSISGKTWVNNHAHVLRFPSLVSQRFVEYYLNSISLKEYVSGMAQPKLNQKSLNSILIPDPEHNVKSEIVDFLDKAFSGIEQARQNTEQNLRNARELFDSYLQQVFSERGDDWEEVELGQVVEFLNGFAFKSKDFVQESDVQLLRMGNLYKNKLDLERKSVYCPNSFLKDYTRYLLEEGDIVLSLTGTAGQRDFGYAVEIKEQPNHLLLNQRIAKISKIDDRLSAKFLLHILRSKVFLDELFSASTGTRQANVSTSAIKKIKIAFPSLDKQIQLIEAISDLEEKVMQLDSVYSKKLAALDELKQSLLQQAFTGQLTQG